MRIASLAPSVTAILQELGVADELVACTSLCPLPDPVRTALAVGSFTTLDESKLATTKPDIVITSTSVQQKGQAKLRLEGYNVLHVDPRSLLAIAESYATIGQAVSREEHGIILQQEFIKKLASLRTEKTNSRPVKVYMEEWHQPPFVAGNWVPDMVALAGGEAVLVEQGAASRPITLEELQHADPDLIVQHVCLPTGYDWNIRRQQLLQELQNRPGWNSLRAVKRGHAVFMEDSFFNMPTRSVLRGVTLLRQLIVETVPVSVR